MNVQMKEMNKANKKEIKESVIFTNSKNDMNKISSNQEFFHGIQKLYTDFQREIIKLGKEQNIGVKTEAIFTVTKVRLKKK